MNQPLIKKSYAYVTGKEKIIMTNEEKVEKIKVLIEEVNELSKELSEEELEAVGGGGQLLRPMSKEQRERRG
jgi:uridylate kinase